MAAPIPLFKEPSALDLATVEILPGGERRYLYPDHSSEAAKAQAHAEAHARFAELQAAEREQAAKVAARVREIIADAPTAADGIEAPLLRHMARLDLARRKASAAIARRDEAQSTADRHEQAKAAYERITIEVHAACTAWVAYATSRDPEDNADDLRDTPNTRQADLAALESEIAETKPLHDVLPLAQFQADVAAGVVVALDLMTPLRQIETLIAAEVPGLLSRIHKAKAVMATAYTEVAALDALTDEMLTFDIGMELAELGIPRRERLLSRSAKGALPAIGDAAVDFAIAADGEALERFRQRIAGLTDPTPDNASDMIEAPPAPSSAPSAFVTRALKLWKG